ncbi:MAG: hypothetical protein J3K34DRAFT_402627 [Monoraphidium minutum]|nr:MAG: hypothetical protein J3K34DRAFT_402627 [Monoraphidium minutum]
MIKAFLVAVIACLAILEPAAALGQPPAAGRKLLQWNRGTQQIAAAQVSRQATQNQIRAAVNNPFPTQQFGATRAATDVGQIGATLTSVDPCSLAWTSNCWGGWGGYGGRWGGRGWGWGRR